MTISSFLQQSPQGNPKKGKHGKESDWLDAGELIIHREARLADSDSFASPSDGLTFPVPKGNYKLQVKVIAFGFDRRISRFRATLPGRLRPKLGAQIGEVGIDSGVITFCEQTVVARLTPADKKQLAQQVSPEKLADVLPSRHGFMAAIKTGFGDGVYTALQLLANNSVAGFEIEFIPKNAPYPFEVKASREPKTTAAQELHWSLVEDIWDPAWDAMRKSAAAGKCFFESLNPGQRALLSINIFDKLLLHMSGVMDLFMGCGNELLPKEILTGYRLLGAEEHERKFAEFVQLCDPIIREQNLSKKLDAYRKLMETDQGKAVQGVEQWFARAARRNAVEKYIPSYLKLHPNEFPGRKPAKIRKL